MMYNLLQCESGEMIKAFRNISVVKLQNDKVLMCYNHHDSREVQATFINVVNGECKATTPITCEEDKSSVIDLTLIDDDTAIMTYVVDDITNDYRLYAKTFDIYDDDLLTSPAIKCNERSTHMVSACKLVDNKILVAYHNRHEQCVLCIQILTIDGTDIEYSQVYEFNIDTLYAFTTANVISNNRVLIGYMANDCKARYALFNIDNDTAKPTLITSVNGDNFSGWELNTVSLDGDRVLVLNSDKSASHVMMASIVSIVGDEIKISEPVKCNDHHSSNMSCVPLTHNKVLVYYSNYEKNVNSLMISIVDDNIVVSDIKPINDATVHRMGALALTDTDILVYQLSMDLEVSVFIDNYTPA